MAQDERDDDGRTEIVGSTPPTGGLDESSPPAATRVLPGTDVDELALAETRVLGDEDKTSPPPVAAAAAGPGPARPSPSPVVAPRPSPAASIGGGDRGLAPGTILFGEYEIVDVLGAGGMGEVYRAHHRRLDEHRAIKVMHAELSARRGASEFFYREAKALLAVRHPAVVHCHDLLSDEAGRVYLIMEMIEGVPLSKRLGAGPLSPDEVAILGARVAHGLAAAHRKGVIHRDLSPDNIVLPNGRVQDAKIIDFGIAKLLEQGEGTIVDGFKGKLSYASPEQLGFFGGKIDGRSDLYSLGLVLVAAALGRPMPMGTTVMEAVDARRQLKALPDAIPIGLRSAIQPLLALEPENRPQYVDRLFVVPGAFDASTESGGLTSPTVRPSARELAPVHGAASRTKLFAGLASAAAIVLGLGAYLAFSDAGRDVPVAAVVPAAPAQSATALAASPTGPAAASAVPVADGSAAEKAAPAPSTSSAAAAAPAVAPAAALAPAPAPAPAAVAVVGVVAGR
jgi:eukaryotic-like serine/threonine-protein kinase